MAEQGMEPANAADARAMKAFDFASDAVKQVLALSTGVLAFTITFMKDFIGHATWPAQVVLVLAWSCYFLSVVGGIWTLYALSGSLGTARTGESPSIYGSNITVPAKMQYSFFLLALLLTLVFGVITVTTGTFSQPAAAPSAHPS